MTNFPSTFIPHENPPAAFGLLVLQSDETIEHDFQRLLSPNLAQFFVSRVPSAIEVSNDSLAAMAQVIPDSTKLFPLNMELDVVGYGCTSATSVIGVHKVSELVKSGCNSDHVTEPLSALIAVCNHLDISRIAFLSPYVEEVSNKLRSTLHEADIQTPVFGSFNEAEERRVAAIDNKSIIDAAIELGRDPSVQALFLSCTNLKTLDVIAEIEATINKPVLSSNLVLAWHMCKLAGINLEIDGFGSLLKGKANTLKFTKPNTRLK